MKHSPCCATRDREQALACAIRAVATELRMIDLVDLVAFIRLERFDNIAHLVNTSAELFFKPGSLRFGHSADVALGWAHPSQLHLDMIFSHGGVRLHFRLMLAAEQAGVTIDYIEFAEPARSAMDNTQHLRLAFASARLADA